MQPADEYESDYAQTIGGGLVSHRTATIACNSSAEQPASSAALVVETIRDEEGLRALEPEWIALENEAGNTLPFRTAAWALAWWKHLRRQCSAVQDHLALRTLRTADGRLVGVAPFMITERPGRGFVRTRCLHFIGTDPNVTELRGGLWAQGYERACMQALKAAVTRDASEWDWMIWNGIPADSAAAETLQDSVTWNRYTPYYTLHLDGDWPTFKSQLRRNLKESLRKCYNSLKRDGLEHSLEVVADSEQMKDALLDFFRLHAQRASSPGSIRHPNTFAMPSARTFLLDVCERLSKRRQARVFRLRVGGSVVATRVGFVMGGTLYLYFSGYEREYGKYSVMTTLLSEVIQYAFREGIGSINLSTGNDVSKTRWAPREWLECDGVTVSPRPLARFAYAAYQFLETTMLTHDVRKRIMRVVSRADDAQAAGKRTIARAAPFFVSAGML
jgi:CelD/BcsL family acetyltransferase involved in cellulose biosynthesis